MTKFRKIFVILAFLGMGFFGVIMSENVQAVDRATILKKWVFTQYYYCSMNELESPVRQLSNRTVAESVFNASASADRYLPSEQFQHSVSSGAVNCKQLLGGVSGLPQSVLGYAGFSDVKFGLTGAQNIMETLGYTMEEESDDFRFKIVGTITSTTEDCTTVVNTTCETKGPVQTPQETPMITVSRQVDGTMRPFWSSGSAWMSEFSLNTGSDDGYHYYITISPNNDWLKGFLKNQDCVLSEASTSNGKIRIDLGRSLEEFNENIRNSGLSNAVWVETCKTSSGNNVMHDKTTTKTYSFKVDEAGDGLAVSEGNGDYIFPDGESDKWKAAYDAILKMSGMRIQDLRLTNNELYNLYLYYLDKALPVGAANRITCTAPADMSGIVEIQVKKSGGEFGTCYINTNGVDLTRKFYTQWYSDLRAATSSSSGLPYPFIGTISLQGIINWFNYVDTSTLDDVPVIDDLGITDETIDLSGGESGRVGDAACKQGSGALGWILCPVLTAVAGIGDTMWNQIEEKYMEVPATEIFRGDGGVEKAWGSIRDMANVIFVILLLVVIFSQLTGVGIDNYGVKRILPRLILVAVLVNLSWVICELAVDLSNIVGNGLETMFNNMGQTIMGGATVTENLSVVSQGVAWTADILVAGGATYLFAFLGAGAPLAALAAIGVAALGIVITVVVALLTLYLILIAREAGIVIAIVLAPAAIVCWALPNTEKIFKRWLDLAKALLLVYPICGALVGGGYLASAVLLNIPNMALAAGIVQVLPYFFIPMILKNSLSALGNIGARISTLGRSLGRRGSGAVRGAIGNSERYKDFQQYQREQGQARRAQRVFNRLNGRTNLSQREQDRLRKAQDVLLAQKRKTDENALRTGGDYYKAAERQQELSLAEENAKVERMVGAGYDAAKISQEKAIDKGRTEDYMALINDRTRNGANEDELNKMFEDYMKSGNKYGAIAAARIAGRRKDTAARFAEKHFGAGGDINNYSENMMRSLSKEMAEGESSAMYKAASPLQFAYASKLNEGSALGQTYEQWASSTENVDNAMSAFVTKSDELISVKKKGLSEIAELMGTDEKPGVMSEKERTRLQTLARETISNRSRIAGWDSTKADEIAKIAGWTYKDGVFRDKTGNVVGGSTEMNIPHGAGGTGGAGDSGSGPAPETFEGGGGI